MIAMVWAQLRRRLGRALALGLAVLVASLGFTVLTASSEASRLQTVGNVNAHARTTYDILVRPPGSRSAVEMRDSLIVPGLMTNGEPGISVDQWRSIQKLSDVDVAAPLAVVGFVAPYVNPAVNTGLSGTKRETTVKVSTVWTSADGLKRAAAPQYTWFSAQTLGAGGAMPDPNTPCGPLDNDQRGVGGVGVTPATMSSSVDCRATTRDMVPDDSGKPCACATVPFPIPMLLVAVDPSEEARLDGLSSATSASALHALDAARPAQYVASSILHVQPVPVLMAPSTSMRGSVDVSVSKLDASVNTVITGQKDLAPLTKKTGSPVAHRGITAQDVYGLMRKVLSSPPVDYPGDVFEYWGVSAPTFVRSANGILTPKLVATPLKDLYSEYPGPLGSDDTRFRELATHRARDSRGGLSLVQARPHRVGDFDITKLTNLRDDTAKILSGWDTVKTVGADRSSRAFLKNQPVSESTNIADLVSASPTLVTSIPNVVSFTKGDWQTESDMSNPITAVRVRVKGVTGIDAASRAKVNLAAQKIQEKTGLDVDVTLGASTTTKTIAEPAGKFGRPALLLSQPWVKKGVGLSILKAVDKKSLVLFTLVLIVSALSVANSAVASVRGRRTELGVLAALGWGRGPIFRTVATELAVIALIAGLVAGAASLLVGQLLGTPVSLARAGLAVPVALLVTLAAGFVPAWMAARSDPMAAVQPAVAAPKKPTPLRSVMRMGVANVGRNRARTLLAALGLLIGVAAFTTLLAITLGFQGAVVGTVLGDLVAIQARTADYMAVGATLLLAGLGVANVLYLNIRDRGAELATLRAVGWERGQLNRMVVVEGLTIAALGAIPGAVVGVLAARFLTGDIQVAVIWAALVAMLIAFALAGLAAIFSARLVHRLPTTTLLTE